MIIVMLRRYLSFLMLVMLGLTACAGSSESTAVIALGKTVYEANCAACHGVDLEGQPDWQIPNEDGTWRAPPHDETGHTWHHDDTYLLERIRSGTATLPADMQADSNMPAYGDQLSEDEIQAVLLFIKNAWPADIQAIQAERSQ